MLFCLNQSMTTSDSDPAEAASLPQSWTKYHREIHKVK